jgi:hypothetical protein
VTGIFSLEDLRAMAAGKIGEHDVPCSQCGPFCRSPKNRIRQVLRVWLVDDRFATWCCARCGSKGEAHANGREGRRIDFDAIRRARAAAAERDRETAALRLGKARWLWRQRRAVPGTIVERYLRDVRGYGGSIPATLGFLPARGEHPAAMIAAFGLPTEPEPGVLAILDDDAKPRDGVLGVQITRLDDAGRKIPGDAKITIGKCLGSPIVLAPMNDLLGLVITEGAEDALSIAEATGLGAWAAGGASRLPALAATVPDFTDAVSVIVDQDDAGRRHSAELIGRLKARRFAVEPIDFGCDARAAA